MGREMAGSEVMAAPRQVVDLGIKRKEVAGLRAIARSRDRGASLRRAWNARA
jgi:hypothetical protein